MVGNRSATVSLVMIVRDEERQLGDCLRGLGELFDEIVVVDTGSSDGTKERAAQFGARVFDFPWCDDFAAARNECLRHATSDWIFWIDADDRLSAENIAKLATLLDSLDDSLQAYMMDTVCWSEFVSDGYTLISHPRLFRRHAAVKWGGRVHEQLRSADAAVQLDTLWSDIRIDHLGYQERGTQQRKFQRNLRLLRMDYAVNPDDESTLLHLGLAYYQLGRWNDARDCLTRLVFQGAKGGDHRRQVYACLAQIPLREGNVRGALAMLDQGLAEFPTDDYLLYLQAECFYELDEYHAAESALLRVQANTARTIYQGGLPGDLKNHLAPRRLADVLRLQQRFADAERLLLSLLASHRFDTHAWHTLGRIYLDCGRGEQLMAVVERMRDCPEGEIFGGLLLALWHLRQNELSHAEQHIDWLVSAAPQMPLPRVLRAELLGRSGSPIAERIKACRDVLRLQPGNLDVRRVLQSLEAAQRTSATVNQAPVMVVGPGSMTTAIVS